MQWDFSSKVFETQVIRLGDTEERIVRGGRDRFALLPKASRVFNKLVSLAGAHRGQRRRRIYASPSPARVLRSKSGCALAVPQWRRRGLSVSPRKMVR
jgi:hypothetical protein